MFQLQLTCRGWRCTLFIIIHSSPFCQTKMQVRKLLQMICRLRQICIAIYADKTTKSFLLSCHSEILFVRCDLHHIPHIMLQMSYIFLVIFFVAVILSKSCEIHHNTYTCKRWDLYQEALQDVHHLWYLRISQLFSSPNRWYSCSHPTAQWQTDYNKATYVVAVAGTDCDMQFCMSVWIWISESCQALASYFRCICSFKNFRFPHLLMCPESATIHKLLLNWRIIKFITCFTETNGHWSRLVCSHHFSHNFISVWNPAPAIPTEKFLWSQRV